MSFGTYVFYLVMLCLICVAGYVMYNQAKENNVTIKLTTKPWHETVEIKNTSCIDKTKTNSKRIVQRIFGLPVSVREIMETESCKN